MDKKKSKKPSVLCVLALLTAHLVLAGCAAFPAHNDPTESTTHTQTGAQGQTLDSQREYTDLWERIRAGYGLQALDSPYVARHEKWFANNPAYMERMVARAQLYLFYIVEAVEKRGFPAEIALLPAIESAFKPHAYSRARAAGLWQFIPSTGRHYGLERNWWYDGRRDVIKATNAALDYLEKLNKDFDGDWHLALAAYNAGETRVMRARRDNRKRGKPTGYQHLRQLKPETRNYVPKLLAMANIVADPAKYGLELATIPNEPHFTVVDIGSQIDLGVLAKQAKVPIGDLYDINPGFKRWATAPKGPFHLLVPLDNEEAILAALESLPIEQRVRWKRHKVRRGDTLSHIARRYGVSVTAVKKSNGIRGTRIRAGQNLMIPVSSRKISTRVANVTKPVKRTRKPAAPPPGRVVVVHKVKSGDTLWSIARQYDVYISQLTRWNLISRRSILRLGQQLKIWVEPGRAPAVSVGSTLPSG